MIRRMTVGVGAVAVVLALAVSSAAAAEKTAAQMIVAQEKIFTASPGYKLLKNFKVRSAAQARSAIPKLQHTKSLLETAAGRVATASTRTAAQRTGRADWVAGVHMVASAIGDLASGLEYLVKGNTTKAGKVLKSSIALDKKGGALAARGDKLLGLPITD